MPRTTVRDHEGTSWRVRTRRGRVLHDRTRPDPGRDAALRHLLGGMLSPWPVPAGHPALAVTEPATEQRRHQAGAADGSAFRVTLAQAPWWALYLPSGTRVRGSTRSGVCWLVELQAGGRLRRGATWQVTGGREAAGRAASVGATVAADVAAGRVPEPRAATLVDVVDRRPNHPGIYR